MQTVPEPSAYAATVLKEALQRLGIRVEGKTEPSVTYSADALLADHISAPLIEEARVTLKVSQNLHASMMPFIIGALGGQAKDNIDQKGFDLEHALLEKAGLDLSAASQSDGAGGAALYTPGSPCHCPSLKTTSRCGWNSRLGPISMTCGFRCSRGDWLRRRTPQRNRAISSTL